MSTVRLELINMAKSPWGLFTRTDPPIRIVWLTHIQPVAEVDDSLLSELDIQAISTACNLGTLKEKGLGLTVTPLAQTRSMKEDLASIARLMKSPSEKERILSRYPEIQNVLNGHHNTVKKTLKKLAVRGTPLRFFIDCKAIETQREGGPRTSVLEAILHIIAAKTSEMDSDRRIDRVTGSSALSDAYYEMIDESDDEEDEEE